MSTTTEHQVSKVNTIALARTITDAVRAGRTITVNGDTPVSFHNQDAAQAWNNGTVSYNIAAKAKGKTRAIYVKVGHMLTISIDHATPSPKVEAPKAPKAKAPKPEPAPVADINAEPLSGQPIPAAVKGEHGWLHLRVVDGKFLYGVTMEEKNASRFRTDSSLRRHLDRAAAAGITVPKLRDAA